MAGRLSSAAATEGLGSHDPARVRDVLAELTTLSETGQPVEVALPDEFWFEDLETDRPDPLPDDLLDDLGVRYLDLVYRYPLLEPYPTPDEARQRALEVTLWRGSHRVAFHHALLLSTHDLADSETRETLSLLRMRGLRDARETGAAGYLVSNLLDHPGVRDATVAELTRMQERADLEPVVEYVRPQLDPPELARLADWLA